jgi:hypothetical protein
MPEKILVIKDVIELWPRAIGLLRAAVYQLPHMETQANEKCVLCEIQKLLKKVEG